MIETLDPLTLDRTTEFRDLPGSSRVPGQRTLAPRGPKKFRVEKAGSGVRVIITDYGPESTEQVGSGAISYLVYWAETVDTSTAAGIAAGFARATLLAPPIPSPRKEDGEAAGFFADPKYQTGYFFCVGIDALGNLSDGAGTSTTGAGLVPVRIQSGTGGTVPPDVLHFQASESGEQHNGTTISAVSYSFQIPQNGGGIEAVQFMYRNYPNLGEISEGESVRITAGVGGTQTGKIKLPIGRRIGTGTITIVFNAVLGVGTKFMSTAQAGDQIEVMGYRARILNVTDDVSIALTANWPGNYPVTAAVADWQIIAAVTIYAVAEGRNGARRDDVTSAPSQTVDLDGDLSTPNAPSLVATTIGNIIRLEVTPPTGTQLARMLLYRHTGAGAAFDKVTYAVIHAFDIDNSNPTQSFQHDDSDFTVYEREQGQTFSYAVSAINVRDQESAASTVVEKACRLDSPADGGPQNPARFHTFNLLWNGMLSGTAGSVGTGDAAQDTNMGVARPTGFNRWDGTTGGTGSTPGFQNGTEVILGIVGAGTTGSSILSQFLDAWDSATARIPKGKMVTIQLKAMHSAGTIDGTLNVHIKQYNGGALQGKAMFRRRLSDDSLDFTTDTLTVNGTDISAAFQMVWGTFLLDDTLTTTRIQVEIFYSTTNYSGVNIIVTEVMLSLGDGMPYWGGPIDPNTIYPGGSGVTPPPRFMDQDSGAKDRIALP